ncbi:cytochrome P450 [Punctularia strigosozonata HHB-11173 SS5]|uniref:cytochrome P450 n=1 Tax=Punctularia strigosozonata (strain HHB-11173) TaxID=741275 RepID=UPI000441745E|nr:cytochrome P450 [Punctularia strigosozonata HHB-11173 SS5]EIN08744.1 cytochrome P450 [Punctularia strigosozonata HHB-11173 SS5]
MLPPGPSKTPFLGHPTRSFPQHEWEVYKLWTDRYGDIIHFRVFGQSKIILGSAAAADFVLEKHSATSSGRPELPLLTQTAGFEWHFAFMPYGEDWRRHRRIFHEKFNQNSVAAFRPMHKRHIKRLLRLLYKSPQSMYENFLYVTGATILDALYGIEVSGTDDPYLKTADVVLQAITEATTTTSASLNSLPPVATVRLIPAWTPGADLKRSALEWRFHAQRMVSLPFSVAKESVVSRIQIPSLLEGVLQKYHGADAGLEEEELIKNVAAAAYEAGSGTAANILHTFTLAMLLYPDVQRRAQAEIDAIVGPERLPEFEDRQHLPYMNRLISEVHRWAPVKPLGLEHTATEDIIYRGYTIPKGATLIPNVWAMFHDKDTYGQDVDAFNPDRFLRPNLQDVPPGFPYGAFGHGRRICPGRYMANNTLFVTIASILACFDISPALDEAGKPIPVQERANAANSHPESFNCRFVPRGARGLQLILGETD